MATTKPNLPTVCGSVYPATTAGFAKFLVEANKVEADGYELVTVVGLDGKIASVFRRGRVEAELGANFFE